MFDCFPLTRLNPSYPLRVRQGMGLDSPGVLWAKGDVTLLNRPAVALIGSRDLNRENKRFAEEAEQEGFNEIAALFSLVGKIEKEHHDRFKALADNIKKGIVFKRDGIMLWQCQNCGHIHAAEAAPEVCPVCKKPQSYFAIRAENY